MPSIRGIQPPNGEKINLTPPPDTSPNLSPETRRLYPPLDMARILYGVHGTGHGHASRALAVARLLPEHEFLFVSHGEGLRRLSAGGRTFDCPTPETVVAAHRVRPLSTALRLLRFLRRRKEAIRSVRRLSEEFRPDAAFTDYEHVVPIVARETGLPCLSLDHQHVIPLCGGIVPPLRVPDFLVTTWAVRRFFSAATEHIVTSFFSPPDHPSQPGVRIIPPIQRPAVLGRSPRDGDHVLAYQGYSTFARFVPFLRQIPHPVLVYGLRREGCDGNLRFKPDADDEFLDDLAGCRYVVCGGGHGLISEALHYGKPVLSFPIRNAIEQFLNAWHLEHLGYGRILPSERPTPDFLRAFEAGLDECRARIRTGVFCGNDLLIGEVRGFLERHGVRARD
jgi:uncharacterized protein (TIGR00661 family)